MTTPEQLALLLSHAEARHLFADLRFVVLDELHALSASKRGDLLALDIARLRTLAPDMLAIGLSATVARPSELRGWLAPQRTPDDAIALADLVVAAGGAKPDIRILDTEVEIPWGGPHDALCRRRDLRRDRAAPAVARVRQHAHAGRAAVPGAVADQRAEPADRAASRLARCHAAAQGRGGDGGGPAQGRRLHIDARSRYRLG